MNNRGEGLVWKLAGDFTVLLAVAVIVGTFSLLAAGGFIVPEDTALRIRLDDTLSSTDSQVGDPFSATVVDQGHYRNARVYGHVAEIDLSGKVRGRTSIMLRFNRLVMLDRRQSQI